MKDQKQLIFTWEDLWQYSENITKAIKAKNNAYSQIVAIARGGFYLADYLSRHLQIPLSIIVAGSYSTEHQRQNLSFGQLSYLREPQGKILLVDDLLDTGVTMTQIKRQLQTDWQVEVDTAVVWQKSQCPYQADYYHSVIPHDVWIVQPFEV